MTERPLRSTGEILQNLFSEPSLEHWMAREGNAPDYPSFSEYITALCKKRGEPPERVIRRADIEKSYGHHLFSGRRKPSRDTVLQLAFGFALDYDGAQQMLRSARKSPLYPRVRRDAVIIFCLAHRYDIVACQEALEQYGLPLLGEGGRNA
ncbi:MAG: hypothetical protein E7427_04940 [Ruminococcaceae bacterium]|jgi:hypothetical protein|nr:hypothetical protein [Oscillospiraceae bacterium]